MKILWKTMEALMIDADYGKLYEAEIADQVRIDYYNWLVVDAKEWDEVNQSYVYWCSSEDFDDVQVMGFEIEEVKKIWQ
jgi:hypothetical protein